MEEEQRTTGSHSEENNHEKIQKMIWISRDKLKELQAKADELDLPLNSYIKLKLFGNNKDAI